MKPSKNLIIILAASVILLSAWVYYMSQINSGTANDYQREFQSVTKQSASDDAEDIEKDLDETDFEGLDAELPGIEAELNSTGEAETQ